MTRALLLLTVAVLFGICPAQTTYCGISLDRVIGEVYQGKLEAGREITFVIRFHNDIAETLDGSSNGFKIYSDDGAHWFPSFAVDTTINGWPPPSTLFDTTWYGQWQDPVDLEPLKWFPDIYDLGLNLPSYSDHDSNLSTPSLFGVGTDTVGFTGWRSGGLGVIASFNEVAWTIGIDSISESSVGTHICIDSSYLRGSPWAWYWFATEHVPSWDGAHCFEIVADCCEGFRGNVNLDLHDTIDISDLTSMVGWMFRSGAAPPCMLEADVDGNDSHDIADVTYLVGYMFKSGPEPAGCP